MNSTSKIITSMLLMAFVWGSAPVRFCSAQQPSFTVQVMSGVDKDAAARFAEALIHQGVEAYIVELEEKEKPVYKVRAGNFINRKAAQQHCETLRMKGIEGWVVQVIEQAAPQAQAAEKIGSAPAQSHEQAAAQQPDTDNAASEKPFELIINPVSTFAEDNKTAPSLKTEPAPAPAQSGKPAAAQQPDTDNAASEKPFELIINPVSTFAEDNKTAPSLKPEPAPATAPAHSGKPAAAQQPDTDNAASEKPFELIINPVPTFAAEEKQTAPPSKTEPAPVCPPAKTYKYFNQGDGIIHITNAIEKVPVQFRSHIWEIAIFPIYFKSLDLRDMSMNTDIEGKTVTVVLEGISRPERAPPSQEVRNFEAALLAKPLCIKYYPALTDPDGTLHGALFFSDGSSVELEMIRRGLATCATEQLSPFQQSACTDAQQKSEGQIKTIKSPH